MKSIFLHAKFYTLLFLALSLVTVVRAQNIHVYVSPGGASTGDGSNISAPVNLERARVICKANTNKAVIVYLSRGTYPAFALDSTDKRTAASPVVWTSSDRYGAVFEPIKTINRALFQAIPDSIKSRIINATAKTKVMQIPFSAIGVTDSTEWPAFSLIANVRIPKFYKDGQPLPMSRYPGGDSTMPMAKVINKGSGNSVPGGSFKYKNDRAKYWLKAVADGGVYLSGNWQAQFEMDVIKTASISTADSVITQSIGILQGLGAQPYGRLTSGQEPYYAMNLVEEINAEGQYAVNFKRKMIYIWVPASGNISFAADCKCPAIKLVKADNNWFYNMAVRGGSGDGFGITECVGVQVAGTSIALCSGNGVTITGGRNVLIQSNDIDSVGAGGVIVQSTNFTNDQFNVQLSGHRVINNHIWTYAREAPLYSGAVNVQSAVGVYVAYNKIHDCPHVGILYGGNSNTLEYNEVYDVVKKYADMGAFYKVEMGKLWLSRGNKLNHNYVHDALPAVGFYTDNYSSGDSSNYNIVVHVQGGFFTHMGYFNHYANNIVVNTQYPVTSEVEPLTSSLYATHFNDLKTMWTNSAAFRAAYPECADMVGGAARNAAYTSRIWPSFKGNWFTANPGILSNSNIDALFMPDGTTNSAYAQSGPVFTTQNTVWQNNIRYEGKRLYPIAPFTLDSLKLRNAFGMTQGTDWHINRIGLHKDSYRTDLSKVRIPECDPVLKATVTSSNGLKANGTITITMGIRFPNAANVIPTTLWYDNGKAITGLYIQKKVVAYDSITYIAQWSNAPAGPHNIWVVGKDGDYWQYQSNSVGFNIANATAEKESAEYATAARLTVDSSVVAAARQDSLKTASRDSLSATLLTLYPNPVSTVLNISYNISEAQSNTNVSIVDMSGRVLIRKTTDLQAGPNQITIPVPGLPNGTYMMTLQSKFGAVQSRRFVIMH